MKRIIALTVALLLAFGAMGAIASAKDIAINSKNFPDDSFRDYVKGFDRDGNGKLSAAECKKIKSIEVIAQGIKNLKGIEHFTNLTSLSCEDNRLTKLDVSKNTKLKWLWCKHNKLTSLKLGKQKYLQELDTSDNQLATLDLGGCPKLKAIIKTHIIVERYDSVLGWRLGYPHPLYTDSKTVLMDGRNTIYREGKVQSISLNEKQKKVTLKKGQLWLPEFTVRPATAACVCAITVKDKDILDSPYDDGTKKALKKGTTTVTIKTEYGQTATIKVTVK